MDNESTTPHDMKHEDVSALLFGSLNEDLADKMSQMIEQELRQGVMNLPLLSPSGEKTSRSEQLVQQLLQPYWRHIDLMEVYNSRNIFSLACLFPPQRKKTSPPPEQVLAWWEAGFPRGDEANANTHQHHHHHQVEALDEKLAEQERILATLEAETAAEVSSNENVLPTENDIPSEQQVQSLQSEIRSLVQQVHQAQSRYRQTQATWLQQQAAQEWAGRAVENLPSTTLETVHSSVTACWMGVQQVQQGQEQAHDLIQLMQQRKQDREGHEGGHFPHLDVDAVVTSLLPPTSYPRTDHHIIHKENSMTTLEERYEQIRNKWSEYGPLSSSASNQLAKVYDVIADSK